VTITDYILIGVVAALLALSAIRDRRKTKKALIIGAKQFWNVLPLFVAVFGLIGLLQVLLTPQMVQTRLGSGAGVLAPLYAAVLGGLATGPPAAVFPLGKFLLSRHASVAAVATLLIAWVAVGTVTLPAEIRFFGARFAVSRWLLAFGLSIVLGLTMGWLM
jgi:uncharacterized membrane protein YraQ (UPF0718 family)